MKKISGLVLILFLFTCSHPVFSQQQVFYVSLAGNDSWSGKLPGPVKNKTDGPFRTFERAKQKVRELNGRRKKGPGTITIFIREGIYTVDETLRLTQKDTGKKGFPVTWKNYQHEKVVLAGGKVIKGFEPVSDKGALERINKNYRNEIYQVNLAASGIDDFGTVTNRGRPGLELFFNNKKMEPARWPNEGWARIAEVPQSGELVYKGGLPHMRFDIPVGRHYGRFTYEGERPSTWSAIDGISLHGYWVWDWFDEFVNIKSIDTATKEIFVKEPHSRYGYSKEQRFYAVNVLEELDRPGEWYIDRAHALLYFWPPSPLDSGRAFVSVLNDPLMELDSVSYVNVEGISFVYSRGNGLVIKAGNDNLIAGCTFSNLGDVAVRIEGGTKNGISSSEIYDVALGGVVLDGGDRKSLVPAGNFVVNTHIHHTGEWIRTYQPAITVSGVGNYIAHNLIHDGPGTGILLTGNEHIIEYNELHHLALETGDVGAFYMGRDWTERGNIIRYNYFHDLKGPGAHDVNAVYLDDWASGTIVQGNIFSDCARGIMIGGGRDNQVSNNIFFGCHPAIHVDSRGLGWARYYFDGTDSTLFKRMAAMNFKRPPFSEKYPILLSLYNDDPAVAKNNVISHNISYEGRWMDLFDGLDFKTVISSDNMIGKPETGQLSNKDFMINENPGIYKDSTGGFRVAPAAMKHGFKKIPFDKIGLQNDAFRERNSLPNK